MNQHRHPPNRLLAWERLQRGWSYEEITERVRAEMVRCGETDTGLTANTLFSRSSRYVLIDRLDVHRLRQAAQAELDSLDPQSSTKDAGTRIWALADELAAATKSDDSRE